MESGVGVAVAARLIGQKYLKKPVALGICFAKLHARFRYGSGKFNNNH